MSKTHPKKSKAGPKKPPAPASKTALKKAKPAAAASKKKTAVKAAPSKPAKPPQKAAAKAVKKAPPAPAKKVPAKKAAPKAAPKPAAKNVKAAPKKAPVKKATAAAAKKAPPAKKAAPAKKTAKQPVKTKAAKPAPAPVKKKTAPAKKAAAAKPQPAKAATKKAPPVAAAPAPAPVNTKAADKKRPAVAPAPAPVPAPAPAPAAKKKGKTAKAEEKHEHAVVIAEPPPSGPRVPQLSSEVPVANASGALFYDSHMHTPLCKHAWGEPEEYAAQGLKSGLKGIIFTCHCPMPEGFWPTVRMADSEFDTYVSIVQRAADAYKGKLDVCLGMESEFFPGCEKWIEKLHGRADFDYILGAVHWQAKEYLNKYESGTIENFRRIYFEHLAQSAESGLYDCLAHPDLVKNYHPDSWCFAIIKNTVSSVLDRIAKTGVAMELNTSGLNKSYSEMNPGNEMLRMMAERNIPVVIGSDAHKAVRVGEHFITALNNLGEAGYEKVSYFQKRQRIDLKISDVLASVRKAIDANA